MDQHRHEKIGKLRRAERLLGDVLAESSGDTATAIQGAIRATKLAVVLTAEPDFPIIVASRPVGAPAPSHDS